MTYQNYSARWIGRPEPAAHEQTADAAVRQELGQCSDADLEAIEEPRFMFLRYTDDQGFRALVTRRQRIARELLAERAKTGADDRLHDNALELLDFPADGRK